MAIGVLFVINHCLASLSPLPYDPSVNGPLVAGPLEPSQLLPSGIRQELHILILLCNEAGYVPGHESSPLLASTVDLLSAFGFCRRASPRPRLSQLGAFHPLLMMHIMLTECMGSCLHRLPAATALTGAVGAFDGPSSCYVGCCGPDRRSLGTMTVLTDGRLLGPALLGRLTVLRAHRSPRNNILLGSPSASWSSCLNMPPTSCHA